MAGVRIPAREAAVLVALAVELWFAVNVWGFALLGNSGPFTRWWDWSLPSGSIWASSVLGPFTGGAGMIVLAVGLLFAIALVGARQHPLVLEVPPDEPSP